MLHNPCILGGPQQRGQDQSTKKQQKANIKNSIAFGSAPRREADSQPISQLDRQAVSQTERHTLGVRQKHTLWVLCQWQTRVQAVGRTTGLRIGSGRMVMQAATDSFVGGSNPSHANTAAAPPPASTDQDWNRRTKNLRLGVLPFDRGQKHTVWVFCQWQMRPQAVGRSRA